MQQLLLNKPAMIFAQKLVATPKIAYSMKNDVYKIASSIRSAYRHLNALEGLGIVRRKHGRFILNNVLSSQHISLVEKLIPSLSSLKNSRRFGRHYNDSDIHFAMNNVQGLITLDYKAWELTKLQYPSNLYIYAKDFNKTIAYLKDNGFSEGKKGHVVILPTIGDFNNEVERVYLDCIAKGGRSIQDAIAIELLYKERLTSKANFSVELVIKVQEDMPKNK